MSITSEDKAILLDLYKITIEEYRFQVSLNWNRSKFYILLNSGLIIATWGLLRVPEFKFAHGSTVPLFIFGLLSSWLGLQTLLKGIEYRRAIIFNKSKLEKKLAEFIDEDLCAISTTKGMQQARKSEARRSWGFPP